MASTATRPRPRPVESLTPLQADPRIAPALDRLSRLSAGLAAVDARERWLRVSTFRGEDNHGTRARLLKEPVPPRPPGTGAPDHAEPSAVDRALALLEGQAPFALAPALELARLEEHRGILQTGLMAQQGIVDALKSQLSRELAEQLSPRHRDLLLAQHRAAQTLAAATLGLELERSELIEAGYTWRADLLPGSRLAASVVLGSEAAPDSDIVRSRRYLTELGIL